jgi:hypothetical protein
MKVFAKNMVKIALIAMVIGIILLGIGFHEYNPFRGINEYFNSEVLEDFGESITLNLNDSSPQHEKDYQSIDTERNESFQSETYEEVESIDIQITIGLVRIQEGDSFQIEANHIDKDKFYTEYSDGKWKISYKENNFNYNPKNITELEEVFETAGYSDNSAPQFIITVPKDFKVDDFILDLDVGKFTTDKIQAENIEVHINTGVFEAEIISADFADLTVDTGEIDVDELKAKQQSGYSVNAGKIDIDHLDAKDITAECGVGELSIEGKITGNNTITNDIGNVNIKIEGKEEDYNYKVDCGIGMVIINDDKYSGVSSQRKNYTGAENSINVECGIGKVSIKIND